jgi:hypothetical protein
VRRRRRTLGLILGRVRDRRSCRAYDELRNFLRFRSQTNQQVSADYRRFHFLRRTATVLRVLQSRLKNLDLHSASCWPRVLTEPQGRRAALDRWRAPRSKAVTDAPVLTDQFQQQPAFGGQSDSHHTDK